MASYTSVVPSLSRSYMLQLLVNYVTIPVLLLQGALLHPYYEPDPFYRKMRAWLAPLIIFLVTYSQKTRLFRPLEDYMHMNYALAAVPTFHIICVTLQYASHRGPARKIDMEKHKKEDPESSTDSDSDHSSSITNSDSQQPPSTVSQDSRISKREPNAKKKLLFKPSKSLAPKLGELARFSIWMTSSPRSLGYVWGPPASILSPAPKRSMGVFLLRELSKLVVNQVALIGFCAIAQPSTTHPERVYGWLSQFVRLPDNQVVRFVLKRSLMAPWGSVGMHAFDMIGNFFTLWELAWIQGARWILPRSSSWRPLPFDTTQYPDLFSKPVLRTSLTEFWGKGWQSVFRRDFIFCGAEPLAKLFAPCGIVASRLAGLLGAMLISGFLHEWGLIAITNEVDWTFRTTIFFVMCGVGIGLEQMFKKLTGCRVGGVLGWIWVWCWFGFWCNAFMDAWFEKGIGLSGMRGPYAVNQWPLAKFLVPLGPILPDRVLSTWARVFSKFLSAVVTLPK